MRPTINLAANICRLRKEEHLTQDDLASFLGVTKASVSKWETGQSYPDIELLPRIATYFGTSVDELMGYAPQLSRADIRRECARLREAFAKETFASAHEKCQQLVHEYYSCFPLLAQIALLYLNHFNLADEPERDELAAEAIELCHRIRRNSDSSADMKLAELTEASLLLVTGNPQASIEALGEIPDIDMGTDILLANAYCSLGQTDKADTILQGTLVQSLALSLNRLAQLGMIWAANPTKLDSAHERALALVDAFNMEGLYVNTAAVHLSFATAYAMGGNVYRALDCLEDYERACRRLEFPIKLHGDEFFDKAESWLEDVNVIGTDAPREDTLNKKSLLESVTANPAFATLADDPRFKRIVKGLQEVIR